MVLTFHLFGQRDFGFAAVYLRLADLRVSGVGVGDSPASISHPTAGVPGLQPYAGVSDFTWVIDNLYSDPPTCATSPFPPLNPFPRWIPKHGHNAHGAIRNTHGLQSLCMATGKRRKLWLWVMRLKWLDPLVAVKEDIVKEVVSKLGVENECTLLVGTDHQG